MNVVNVVIVGAGVVGCAVARELALRGLEPLVLEQGPRIAEGVTSRNSGVIHAGIYYPPGSLKAECCIEGNGLLYEWCRERGIPHRRTGKWIVGSKDEQEELEKLLKNALDSGARGLSRRGADAIARELPGVRADVAIHSEETGIVDPYEFSRSLIVAAEEKGAQLLTHAGVTAIERLASGGYRVETTRGPVETDAVVNAAGLHADEVAAMAGAGKYRIYPCRGDYFRFDPPHRYITLIYPVKKKGAAGLGVHLTIGLDGSYRLGPDVAYVDSKTDFADPKDPVSKRTAFAKAVQAYLPSVKETDIRYDSCGLRPKLRAPGEPEEKDFVLSQDLPGFINLMGIESPGLTASMALARRVARLF